MKVLKYCLALVMAAVLSAPEMPARRFAVSTNLAGYANLGTMNAELSYSFSRRWTVNAGIKYNPWTFRASSPARQFQNRQQAYAAGVRFWPWHVYSGWWIAGKLQYQEYNSGGMISRRTEEGDRVGAGLTAGYTYMLHRNLNIEFGIGLWAGMKWYTEYACPACGMTLSSGRKGFILPNDLLISISYVF